jgi:small GTP-binding protein
MSTEFDSYRARFNDGYYITLSAEQLLDIFRKTKESNTDSLDLSGYCITELPEEIGKLTNLQYLNLDNNHLTELPEAIGELKNLKKLSVSSCEQGVYNPLFELPAEITKLSRLKYLNLTGTMLPIPPEILARTDEPWNILKYYFQIVADRQGRSLNEAKLLLVGQGGVGKTSLIKRLISDEFSQNEPKTEGIDVTRWSVSNQNKRVLLNVWDFGGQEIMHATHQFFLTKRSLYILVIDARLDEQQNALEYWLKIIRSFGSDSPIFVMMNKIDENQTLYLDRRGLKDKYPSIEEFFRVSCKTGEGIAEIRQEIIERSTSLKHVSTHWLNSWFRVKTHLENMSCDYISYNKYLKLCDEEGIWASWERKTLIGFLHDLGTLVSGNCPPPNPILE